MRQPARVVPAVTSCDGLAKHLLAARAGKGRDGVKEDADPPR